MEALDPRVGIAIDHAIAASRWRIAARFEGPQQAERFKRQANLRRSAATGLLNEVAQAGRGLESPAAPRPTRDGVQGG